MNLHFNKLTILGNRAIAPQQRPITATLTAKACRSLILACMLCFITHVAQAASDTLHVVTHNRETVVTDPAKGYKSYNKWGFFPLDPAEVRKVIMKVTLGCPDSMRCADWDYSDRISIRRKGGLKGEDMNYEIGRMLTPYGGAFSKDWKFQWEVDVTDFAILLRDSVEIEYNHSGYEPNKDRGWAVTLDFEFIKGTPARLPIGISKIYDAHFAYGDAANPIDKALVPVEFSGMKGAASARLRIIQTGHGMDEPDGCGEFCSKFREVLFDNKVVNKRFLWKECADNALYPQAGTWLIDRANWCPGYLVQPDCFDFKIKKGRKHSIQFKMQNYQAVKPSAEEVISAYLIQYAEAPQKNDLAIEDVMAPSSKDIYSRVNTESLFPRLIVSNKGGSVLKSFTVKYDFGAESKMYRWTGNLLPWAVDTIALPEPIPPRASVFNASVVKVNSVNDGYVADNTFSTRFQPIPQVDDKLILTLATNKEAAQTSYLLRDAMGKVYYQRALGSLAPQTVYNEAFSLPKGVYQFLLEDQEHDGLEFWFNAKGGAGYAYLKNADGDLVKVFQPDFGKSASFVFEVDGAKHPADKDLTAFSLFPTRTNDFTTLQFHTNSDGDVRVELVADPGGNVVEQYTYRDTKEAKITYDLSKYPKGRFFLKVYVNDALKFSKRVRLKE